MKLPKATKFIIPLVLFTSSIKAQNQPQVTIYNTSTCPLPNNSISDIKIDHLGNKWFGTYGGGLVRYDGSNWTVYNTSNSGIPSNQVSCIDEDANGNIWIGTRTAQFGSNMGEGSGIAKFNGTTWTTYNTSNSNILDDVVNCIKCSQGNVFVGIGYNSPINGLSIFDGNTWSNYQSPVQSVFSIDLDQNNNLWLRDIHGFYQFSNGNISHLYSLNGNLETMGSLKVDANNNVWASGMSINNGVFVKYNSTSASWENRDTNITVYSQFNASNYPIWDIEMDSHNNLWYAQTETDPSEPRGLTKFDGTSWNSYGYDNISCMAIEANSNIWLGDPDNGLRLIEACSPITSQPQDQNTQIGSNVSFTMGLSGTGNTYQWQVDKNAGLGFENIVDGAIYAGSTTQTLIVNNVQNYLADYKFRCKVDSGSLCNQISNQIKITFGATAINNVNSNSIDFKIYPNPTSDILNIASDSEVKTVNVFNIVGEIENVKISKGKIDLSKLSNGIYFIRINNEYVYKVVKK